MTEYIDRESVKEIMQRHRCSDCTNEKSLDCPLCQLHRPFAEISKLPAADVQEVRHGEWHTIRETTDSKTRSQVFLEQNPNAKTENGIPIICPPSVDRNEKMRGWRVLLVLG